MYNGLGKQIIIKKKISKKLSHRKDTRKTVLNKLPPNNN